MSEISAARRRGVDPLADLIHDASGCTIAHSPNASDNWCPGARLAARVADALREAYYLIPADQIENLEHEYQVPVELVEDLPCAERFHADVAVHAIAETVRSRRVIVEEPVRHRLPVHPDFARLMVRYKLTARARRLPETP